MQEPKIIDYPKDAVVRKRLLDHLRNLVGTKVFQTNVANVKRFLQGK